MKICAINGSPRKRGNTARLLSWALDGVKNAREDAETELINLYDLSFTGCRSCFSCKRVNGPSYGRCAVKDDLAPVLEKLADADGVILGSPVYLMGLSGMMRCFLGAGSIPISCTMLPGVPLLRSAWPRPCFTP